MSGEFGNNIECPLDAPNRLFNNGRAILKVKYELVILYLSRTGFDLIEMTG